MALTDQDFKLVLTGYWEDDLDNPIQNQFWYKADSANGSAPNLAVTFATAIVPTIALILSSSFQFTTIEVINLVDLQDFTTADINIDGERASNVVTLKDAWGFRFLRPRRGMHDGSKRFGPIAIGDVVNKAPITSLLVTLDNVSDTLQAQLASESPAVNYDPCCVKMVKVQNASNAKFHYEPEDLFICNSVSFTGVSHQDTR